MTHETDTLRRFTFETEHVRGEWIHLDQAFRDIIKQHAYPPPLQRFLGETIASAALLTATMKIPGTLTIQLQTENSPIKLLVAKCNHKLEIRATAQWDRLAAAETLADQLYLSQLVITIQRDDNAKFYQSIIALSGRSISDALQEYFMQSEQLPTAIRLASDEGRTAGLLLQTLPGFNSEQDQDFFQHTTVLADTLTDTELLDLPHDTLLYRLYHQHQIRIFDAKPVQFSCPCSEQAMANAIRTMSREEAESMLLKHHRIAVNCEYCNKEFLFDKNDIARIFDSSMTH